MYKSLKQCCDDLEAHGRLVRIKEEVDPHLTMAAFQRQLYEKQGPAVLFEQVKGSPFPAVCNLFGTVERARFILRHRIDLVKRVIELKADPSAALKTPWRYWRAAFAAIAALPKKTSSAASLANTTSIDQLPQIVSWPQDGGAFITLPQVFTRSPANHAIMKSNLGMYRIQLSGNQYTSNKEIGLHYQIHRGIGIHHTQARDLGQKLRVSIFVGGHPAHTLAAVMPLPEGLSELTFAGMLAGRRFRYSESHGHTLAADADFVITGTIDPTHTKPEGPFGDHLGYYSLCHDFPVMDVEKVYHRKDAIWPFTVVGRPPQEDTTFGKLIHELTGPVVPTEIPGLRSLHAVDAAGVHPLLLAIGSERYTPYATANKRPQEILTVANAILGFGQCSLAKYLMICAGEDDPNLDIHDIRAYMLHVLRRIDWRRDLHFQTCTTMDTLDYSGDGLNQGSKVVMAACGQPVRHLGESLPSTPILLPEGFTNPQLVAPGILALSCPKVNDAKAAAEQVDALTSNLEKCDLKEYPLIVLSEDASFLAADFRNFLWVTFTRSNPSHDIYGVRSFQHNKHWGCEGPLIIDSRIKPHHAPPLVEDDRAEEEARKLLGKYVFNGKG